MKVVSRDLDKIIEIWSVKLNGIGPEVKFTNESYYEVHVEICHGGNNGERRITDIFPEYGEVTDAIRKKLEEVVQKMEVI